MLLNLVVLVGLAVHLAIQAAWILSVLALLALWPRHGIRIAIPLTPLLGVAGHIWPAVILGALVSYNLVGNYLLNRYRTNGTAR